MATKLQDSTLLARISGGDLVANEAQYNIDCLVKFRNSYRAADRACARSKVSNDDKPLQSIVFAELVSHIESKVETGTYIFNLSDLHCMYEDRLRIAGIENTTNRFRLKLKLLGKFGQECQEQTDGKNTLLVFNEGLQKLMKVAAESRDYDDEALMKTKLVKTVRRDMFDWKSFELKGNFDENCQEKAVPTTLKALVSMLLNGPNVEEQESIVLQACLTIAQMILFNAKTKAPKTNSPRHVKGREPPLPLYVGLSLHTQTRSKKSIDIMHKIGLSISYFRVLETENQLGTAICKRFMQEGLVCPAILRKGLYTVGALDDIDHNPSSMTAQRSFHGTGISIFQFPTLSSKGSCRKQPAIEPTTDIVDFSLPDNYTTVPAVTCKTSEITVPEITCNRIIGHLEEAQKDETWWADHGIELLEKEKLGKKDNASWAAYHASHQLEPTDPPALNSLLPLFYEKAATFSMVKHGMDIVKQITNHPNPGQIPVIALDQPLFTTAKYVQWQFPDTNGEGMYVVMFGGLHIEISLWNTIGEFLEGSGWTSALCDAGIVTQGTADSSLKASNLTKTRHCHQVTYLTFIKLQKDAWERSVTSMQRTFEMWMQSSSSLYQEMPISECWVNVYRTVYFYWLV